ncbi:MAG: glutathione S-transferase [Pseudomonadales bacterium]|nr:glutathione S-transferase [Pseudomonadales bacterium]
MQTLPILYSFRRCPYAMRARLAIHFSGIKVELREVILRDKPPSMLSYSAKGTVPLLVLDSGQVIDESIDILYWALNQQDPKHLLNEQDDRSPVDALIKKNDHEFKHWLDRYKYSDRHPEFSTQYYRDNALPFIEKLDQLLSVKPYLFSHEISAADISIAPFIRQFANVDKVWFEQTPYPKLQDWLTRIVDSQPFKDIFKKYPQWHCDDNPTYFPIDA